MQLVWNSHVCHMKSRSGKMVLIGNESLEEGAGGTFNICGLNDLLCSSQVSLIDKDDVQL